MIDEDGKRRGNFGRGLGRGLQALFGDEADMYRPMDTAQQARLLPIEALVANPFQPRRRFDEAELESLAESVREQGILQPILVRPAANAPNRYQIIAGERRWRAAQRAQLHEVPVVIRQLSDSDALQVALIENVQRQDLTALEEAEGFRQLIEEFGHTQETLARAVGKSRSHIANTLRLLDLPGEVRSLVQEGQLSAGHARTLLGCDDPAAAARVVLDQGLNVRQTEALVREWSGRSAGEAPSRRPRAPRRREKDPDTRQLEEEISALLGLRVTIDATDASSGALTIHYATLEQLDVILHRLSHGPPAV